jgi:hypothetical protein
MTSFFAFGGSRWIFRSSSGDITAGTCRSQSVIYSATGDVPKHVSDVGYQTLPL